MNRDPYPRPIVPEFLVKRTIETMPLETAFYLEPGDEDDFFDFDVPVFCVTTDGTLRTQSSANLDQNDTRPSSPAGRIGIMKVGVVDGDTFRQGLIADLRFLKDGQLMQLDDTPPDDPEDFNAWVALRKDLRPVTAFVAPSDVDDESDEGVFYGPEAFRDALAMLRDHGDSLMKVAKRKEKKQKQALARAATKAEKVKEKVKRDN